MEWQANFLSSVLLMPKKAVQLLASQYPEDPKTLKGAYGLVHRVADVFNVSTEAATYRLKELKIIPDNHATVNYHTLSVIACFD